MMVGAPYAGSAPGSLDSLVQTASLMRILAVNSTAWSFGLLAALSEVPQSKARYLASLCCDEN